MTESKPVASTPATTFFTSPSASEASKPASTRVETKPTEVKNEDSTRSRTPTTTATSISMSAPTPTSIPAFDHDQLEHASRASYEELDQDGEFLPTVSAYPLSVLCNLVLFSAG